MERKEAFDKLLLLQGRDFHELAREHGIEVISSRTGKVNKGWAGHVLERCLGLPINSSQAPNFGSWELKLVPMKHLQSGKLVFKETMQITMIDSRHVELYPFEDSHLLTKLRRALIVARTVGNHLQNPQYIHSVAFVDMDEDQNLFDIVEQDYNEIRNCIINRGFEQLTGRMGNYVQPRTKGRGHGSTSRAFYARKQFLYHVFNFDEDMLVQ